MPNLQGFGVEGIGGTGFCRLHARKRWRQSTGKSTDAIPEGDPAQLFALLRKSHPGHRPRNNERFRHSSQFARDKARQQATDAAIAAYQGALRSDDPRQEACKAALRAYLEICPNDTDVSDQVVKAIILATVNLTSKP
jgi:hypothetical protein